MLCDAVANFNGVTLQQSPKGAKKSAKKTAKKTAAKKKAKKAK